MALDEFGKLAAAEIAFYIPILGIALFSALKNGFTKGHGWVYFVMFSTIRIVGAAISISTKTTSNPSTGLIVASIILQGIGLSPLLLATLAFVTKIASYGAPSLSMALRLIRLALVAAPALAAAGGSMESPDNSASSMATGRTLIRVGGLLFMATYASLVAVVIVLWGARRNVPANHCTLLSGISLALPFLFVRIIYTLLGDFASSSQSRWSPVAGDWRIYLFMGLIMEYLTVCIYVLTGALTPLHKDDEPGYQAPGYQAPGYQAPGYQAPGPGPHRVSAESLLEMGKRRYLRT